MGSPLSPGLWRVPLKPTCSIKVQDIYAKPNVRVATADRYHLMIEQYTIPRIGNIKLTKLAAHDLQKLYKELMESGRTNRKSGHGNPGLSSTTVRSLHLMLHNALNRAVKERLILRNPTEDCIAPKVQKFEMQILQPEHIKIYLDAAEKRGLLPMFYLELVSGLRKGEVYRRFRQPAERRAGASPDPVL